MVAIGRIDLLIPGLLGPIPVLPGDLPDLPSLSRLLGKADSRQGAGTDIISVLFERFGMDLAPDRDPPSAAFSRLADRSDTPSAAYWLHADPVHLRPDRDRLLLFDSRHLGLEQQETDSLIELFNGHFAADGLNLEAPSRARWYLRLEQPPGIRTRPLADVVGRDIGRSYLGGDEAKQWMRWLNEAQMLFHHSDVNRQRELTGRPGVSGIWPWGGGSLPAAMPRPRYRSVFADAPLAVGLGIATGAQTHRLPRDPCELPGEGRTEPALLLWDALWPAVLDADADTWIRELSRLDDWILGLVNRLKAGGLAQIDLFPCDGTCLAVKRSALRRFWRRSVDIGGQIQRTPTG